MLCSTWFISILVRIMQYISGQASKNFLLNRENFKDMMYQPMTDDNTISLDQLTRRGSLTPMKQPNYTWVV